MAKSSFYTHGGTVGRGIYISRQADDDLLGLCQAGEYAYVLTSRQMGKSSLMVKTAKRLQAEGIFSITIDLMQIGKAGVTPESWYWGVLRGIEDAIENQGQALTTDIGDWWAAHPSLTITQRFIRFFRDVLLPELDGRVVVFIDEIDTTRSLDFTDDFFIAIRAMYTARAETKIYERLSFVLIGAATPANLIDDPHRTPFNIGHRVDLTDFTLTEAQPLATGLGIADADRARVFERILAWTDGHPYLTQRLCIEVARQSRPQWAEADVDEVVSQLFFGDRRYSDDHLQLVGALLSDSEKVPDLYQVLTTYRDIWRDRQPVIDEKQSLTKAHLKLSGVVKQGEHNVLRVRNQIYQTVFDDQWVADHLPVNWGKRIQQSQRAIAVSFLVTGVMTGLTGWAITERQQAEKLRQDAEKQEAIALEERDKARTAERLAEYRLRNAEEAERWAMERQQREEEARQAEADQRQQADQARQAETMQRQRAEAGEAEAQEQTRIAIAEQQRAEKQTSIANQQRTIAQLREQAARSLNLLSTASAVPGMILAIDTMDRSWLKPEVNITAQASLLKAVQVSQEVNRLRGHGAAVLSVAFNGDGTQIVSGGRDGTVRLWDVSPANWLAIACNRLQHHPLLIQPEASLDLEFREVAIRARDACQQRVWQSSTNSSPPPITWLANLIRHFT